MPRKIRWKRLAIWLLSLAAVGTIVLDVTLRVAFGFGNPLLYGQDATAQYVVSPSQDVTRFGCRNSINRYSMRCSEVIEPKPAGELRFLFVGDSFTYGTTYVDQADIFTTLLANDLPGRLGKPVEVLNASAGGWAPANELGYLRSRGTFHADVVLLVLNTGDLIQSVATLPAGSPAFPEKKPFCALAEVWSHYLVPRLKRQSIADAGSFAVVADVAQQTPRNLALVDQAKSVALTAGARFVVVYIPSSGAEWASYAPGVQLLRDWCADSKTALVDLTPSFATVPAEQIAFDNGHGHLRPAGHKLVAAALAQFFQTQAKPVSATSRSTKATNVP